jgi:hypothetical protein
LNGEVEGIEDFAILYIIVVVVSSSFGLVLVEFRV